MFELPILVIKPFTHLSVSKIETFELCPLKVIFETNNSKEIFPPNPNVILGSVIHKIFEVAPMITTLEGFEIVWSQELERLISKYKDTIFEKELGNFTWQCKHYYPKKNIAKKYVLEQQKRRDGKEKSDNAYRFQTEKLLIFDRIRGKVDVYIEKGETLIIKDYKTGNVFENSNFDDYTLKSSFIKQVQLYAGIAVKTKPFKNIELYIVNSNGKEYQVNVEMNECLKLLTDTLSKVEKVSKSIEQRDINQLAVINKNCKFCNFRYYCPHFEELSNIGLSQYHFDLVGELTSILKVKNGIELYINEDKVHLTSKNNRYKIEDLKSLKGQSIIVFNVFQSKQTTDYFASSNTIIFLKKAKENLIRVEC